MTPKEKAKELVKKYDFLATGPYEWTPEAKKCALIAVDEILRDYASMLGKGAIDFIKMPNPLGYWFEVKEEIEKL